MKCEEVKKIVSQMTVEEKAGMCSGADFWHLKGVERLGIPSVMVSDGPHGLRKQEACGDHLGVNDSIKAVCFPAGCAIASSFDRTLVKKMGETIGEECQAENVSTILGPAMNIKRSPLCGRNFEYYSEDPYLSTEIASAMIEGVQSKNIGTSVKHFLANNQEMRRMTNSSEVDERTLREIYLASFEGAVKNAKPWTVMSSYNLINGRYVGEDSQYLTNILRNEWGFEGYVMSDWGAVNDRVQALKAGLDLEMPPSGVYDELIVKAVKDGTLEESVLDVACERILNIIFRYTENRSEAAVFDKNKDHEIAAEIEAECIVLLKNEEQILPINGKKKIAFIGKYAESPRYQGGGSSHINSFKVESALEAVKEFAQVIYAKGYEDDKDAVSQKLQEEAIRTAREAEVAVIFAGLPDNFESEGYDRKHLCLPNCQNHLIKEILKVQKNVIVVLHNGSPVEMPWKNEVKGIVEAYLGGQAVGKAVVQVLFGKVNPSGRLAETFPLHLEDTPCYLSYGKGRDLADYQEGVFVGYRYYTSKKQDVLFPFGHGLSYTTFAYSNLQLDKSVINDDEKLTVTVKVKNTGNMFGKEVVQLYVSPEENEIARPLRELKGFEKIALQPGEEKTVAFELKKRAFAYWKEDIYDWYVSDGEYQIQIGKNAEEIILSENVTVHSTTVLPKRYSMNSCFGDLLQDEHACAIMRPFWDGMNETGEDASEAISMEMMAAMMDAMPLRQLLSFVPEMKIEDLEQILAVLNA